jgi:hypothetical protein
MPCHWENGSHCFERSYSPHLQGQKSSCMGCWGMTLVPVMRAAKNKCGWQAKGGGRGTAIHLGLLGPKDEDSMIL